jgi:NTP pyrophosphatase (non-canonical NTP hydrolase)
MSEKITLSTKDAINELSRECHEANKRWWQDPKTGQPIQRNRGEQLMLIVSEIAEAMEGERKDLMDDKLPHRKMAEVELADAVIRILDYSYGHGYDLGGAFVEKMKYNTSRVDHTNEARLKTGGKRF